MFNSVLALGDIVLFPMFIVYGIGALFAIFIGLPLLAFLIGVRYIPHNQIGVIEKLWSPFGSLKDGGIVSVDGRAGFQAQILRGGLHFGFFPWQYRVHKQPLVQISEGRIGYVYARDGQPLLPAQTLGHTVECNAFQNALAFLLGGGQRGRQRAILREGVYAVNLALFVVIAEDRVYSGPLNDAQIGKYAQWHTILKEIDAFRPVVLGTGIPATMQAAQNQEESRPTVANRQRALSLAAEEEKDRQEHLSTDLQPGDQIGVMTVHDGPPLLPGDIIAPNVQPHDHGQKGHSYFQDPEAFLELGGRRGKQLQVLTDGTFFINRWFATVEFRSKTLIPIGYVGAIVSYCGQTGEDTSGTAFRYGEQVENGQRGVWKSALPPGKYPLNPYAMKLELVPTVNFVLRWITGQDEEHGYDQSLNSIELITADGYEPVLPLSLVVHIDYEKAPSVIQRFGDVKRLINQTLDPILSAYFRDVAQNSQMLEFLTKREEIQQKATTELGRRFKEFDINCVAVLIGRPQSRVKAGQEDPIERLFDQLRTRRLAEEQVETYSKQQEAAVCQRELNDARAAAEKQMELTQTKINVEIAQKRGEAQTAEARELAKREVALADAEKQKRVLMAEAEGQTIMLKAEGESRAKELLGQGEAKAKEMVGKAEAERVERLGLAEAVGLLRKLQAYGDPRVYALQMVGEQFARSRQPLVPERVVMLGADSGEGVGGKVPSALNSLFALMLADKIGSPEPLPLNGNGQRAQADLEKLVEHATASVVKTAK